MSVETDYPRVRLAKREIARALEAVEKCDAESLETGMQMADLEAQVQALEARCETEARRAEEAGYRRGIEEWAEETSRWRRSYEAVKDILATTGPQGRVEALDKALRDFVGKA